MGSSNRSSMFRLSTCKGTKSYEKLKRQCPDILALVLSYLIPTHTDKKENKFFPHIYKEIQMGSSAKSYMRKGFLIYAEMRKFFPIYENAVSHI
jgi:hypothetical protein